MRFAPLPAFFVFSLFFSAFGGWASATPHTVCFFEFDNTKASGNLIKKIGATGAGPCKSAKDMQVCSYVADAEGGESALQAVERMIQSGQKCDGLSFSGHHTGNWYGETAGTLKLKDLEALSCREEYKNWFQNIKALWLDGCNTVTDEFIQPRRSADSEAVRVAGKEYEEKPNSLRGRQIRNLQQAYAGSLDENTSLSSRYLRIFPETQIYGFLGAAPAVNGKGGDQVRDSSWIYSHMIHLGKAIQAEENYRDMESDLEWAVEKLFTDDPCEEPLNVWEMEEIVPSGADLQAVEHRDYGEERRLGCDLILSKQILDNPDHESSLRAAQDLANRIKEREDSYTAEALELANQILDDPNNPEKALKLAKKMILDTLQEINTADSKSQEGDKKYAHILFNNLYETWETAKKYKKKDPNFFNAVKAGFQHESFSSSLEGRIVSDFTASLRKADYISFYTEVHDIDIARGTSPSERLALAQQGVRDLLRKANSLFPDLKSARQSNLPENAKRALAVSVADQLLQYGLLNERQIGELANNRNLFPNENDTENRFFIDTYVKLSYAHNPEQTLNRIAGYKNPVWITQAVQTVGNVYLREGTIDIEGLNNLAIINTDKPASFRQGLMNSLLNNVFERNNRTWPSDSQIESFKSLKERANRDLENFLRKYLLSNISPEGNNAGWLDMCESFDKKREWCQKKMDKY